MHYPPFARFKSTNNKIFKRLAKKKPPIAGGKTATQRLSATKTRPPTHRTADARHPTAAAPKNRTETPQRATQGRRPARRTPRKSRAARPERRNGKHDRTRRSGANERIRATGATDRHGPATSKHRGRHTRNQWAKNRRQAPATGKPDHRRGGGRRKQGKRRHNYAPAPTEHETANRAASARDARPRPTGATDATGTETAKPPGTGRTTHPRHTGGKRRPQDKANRAAATGEENRTTATKPENARREGRNDTPRAQPAHGANEARAERTTDETSGTKAERDTAHPQTQTAQKKPTHRRRERRKRPPGAGDRDGREPKTPPPRRQGQGGDAQRPETSEGARARSGERSDRTLVAHSERRAEARKAPQARRGGKCERSERKQQGCQARDGAKHGGTGARMAPGLLAAVHDLAWFQDQSGFAPGAHSPQGRAQ